MEIQHKRQIFLVTNNLLCTQKLLAGPSLWAIALLEPGSSGTGLQSRSVWFSLTAPIVCLGFVGCLELRQPRAGSGNVSGIRCSTPKTNPLPEGGTHPSLMYKKRHYCIVSVLSGFLALPSDSINILRISFLQPLSGSTWMFSSQVL